MIKRREVVVDAGSYSLSERSIAGAGLRLAEIAQVLSRHYAVRIIATAATDQVFLGEAEVVPPGREAERGIASADAVLFFDTPNRDRVDLAVSRRKLIVGECRPPIEHLEYPSMLAHDDPTGEYQKFLASYRRLLHVSHHFLCRSEDERSALVSTLCAFGRLTPADVARSRTLDHLVSTVPIGFSEHSLRAADATEPVPLADFLWTGGMWSCYEPLMLVEAVALLRDRGVDTTAAFLHATPVDDTRALVEAVEARVSALGLEDRVHLNTEPLPFSQRDQYVKAARAHVCIAKPGAENRTTTRLRLRDSWLHGIPAIVDGHGHSGDVVAREGLGVVLRAPDVRSLADAMERFATDRPAAPGRRVERLYETTLRGFTEWLDRALSSV